MVPYRPRRIQLSRYIFRKKNLGETIIKKDVRTTVCEVGLIKVGWPCMDLIAAMLWVFNYLFNDLGNASLPDNTNLNQELVSQGVRDGAHKEHGTSCCRSRLREQSEGCASTRGLEGRMSVGYEIPALHQVSWFPTLPLHIMG